MTPGPSGSPGAHVTGSAHVTARTFGGGGEHPSIYPLSSPGQGSSSGVWVPGRPACGHAPVCVHTSVGCMCSSVGGSTCQAVSVSASVSDVSVCLPRSWILLCENIWSVVFACPFSGLEASGRRLSGPWGLAGAGLAGLVFPKVGLLDRRGPQGARGQAGQVSGRRCVSSGGRSLRVQG